MSDLINAAAHAFAMVCLADGNLAWEEKRFESFAATDPSLSSFSRSEATAAWQRAIKAVETSKNYAVPLAAIRGWVTDANGATCVLRAAQAAIIADQRIEPQENTAIRAIADALNLDPDVA